MLHIVFNFLGMPRQMSDMSSAIRTVHKRLAGQALLRQAMERRLQRYRQLVSLQALLHGSRAVFSLVLSEQDVGHGVGNYTLASQS